MNKPGKDGQLLFVVHRNSLTIALTLAANYAALRWQPVMWHVQLNNYETNSLGSG